MCGIAGIFNKEQAANPAALKKMTDVIFHRGPDGEGHWLNNKQNVALGHRRLSIIDLSNHAAQPMQYANARYTITFNGEIYNYVEIKEQLQKLGYQFQSTSDTEVLLALYAEKKENCLQDLDGMFAFAIWDEAEQKLFCARDRFGEKPFHFYYEKGKQFVFGSEIKQLHAYGVKKEVNNKMLFNYLTNIHAMHDPRSPQETFYNNILRLEPAHYLVVDANLNLVVKKYWDLNLHDENNQISVQNAAEKFYELMLQSVKIRLRSDVPVGSSLSGGLDSSTIVCLIDQLNSNKAIKQKTFSARFKDFERDEGKFMQMVINQTLVEPHFTFPDENGFVKDFQKLCFHQEEPFGSASIYAQWEVMKLAHANNVTVLLDGQGADESLAGYHYYFITYLKELKRNNSPLFEKELAAYRNRYNPNFSLEATNATNTAQPKPTLRATLRSIYRLIFPVPPEKVYGYSSDFLTLDFAQQFAEKQLPSHHDGTLKEQLYINNCVIGLNNLLRFADRNSMAFSREMRLPFLSHQLVEFLFSLPSSYKIHDGWSKYVMRLAFEKVLPKEIAWRTDKIGYEPPQNKWMKSPQIVALTADAISSMEQKGIVNKKRKQTGYTNEWAALVVANTLLN